MSFLRFACGFMKHPEQAAAHFYNIHGDDEINESLMLRF